VADSPIPDIGDERLIDEDASTLYEEAPCGYLYTRPDGTLLRVNARFLSWTGYERHELLGRRFQDLLTIGGRIYHETHFGPLLHMQGSVSEIALEIVTRSGALLPVLVNSVQKRDAGKPVLNRTTVFNATERKQYERELQLARKRAEESARAKAELLATISHDMRSPLGAILGAAQLLARSPLPASQQTYLRILRSSSETLLNLINNVLDLNKIESGRVLLEKRAFDLRQLVLDLLASLNVRAEEKQLTLRVAIDNELPDRVVGDPVKIGQILTNLVANAVKFTENGSVAVTVRARRQSADAVALDFSVADTGIGIPADRLQQIFDDFTQAGDDVGATYGGYGLGLAIVRRLLALHGSTISVESAVGRGSIFSFSLTLEVAEEASAGSEVGGGRELVDARLLNGTRVLLVEDNTFDTFMVGRSLDAWGVKFDVALTVSEAVDRARANAYDAVLLSARLANGAAAAARAIREAAGERSPVPAVLALGALRAADLEHQHQDLITDIVPKPVDPTVLFAKLAALRS